MSEPTTDTDADLPLREQVALLRAHVATLEARVGQLTGFLSLDDDKVSLEAQHNLLHRASMARRGRRRA